GRRARRRAGGTGWSSEQPGAPFAPGRTTCLPPPPLREDRGEGGLSQLGRSILQLVASTVLAASRRVIMRQPQPVFSSSNGSLSLRSPNEAIYMGWKNW